MLNLHTASEQLFQTEVSDILIENMDEKNDATTTMHINEDEDTNDIQLFKRQKLHLKQQLKLNIHNLKGAPSE